MKPLILLFPLFLLLSCQETEPLSPEMPQDDVVSKSLHSRIAFPDVISLPTGFQPEGIVVGPGSEFFVGSGLSGKIYKGNLRTGEGEIFITPSVPTQVLGMAIDVRSGYLFAAGGFSGTVMVYESKTGTLVQTFQLAAPGTALINDVIVTRQAAFITNSIAPVIYKIPLSGNGQLPDPSEVTALTLTGDFSMVPNPANPFPLGAYANGIDASPTGEILFLANTDRGEIYRVDPMTGESILIDLGGVLLFFADGILLDGKTLYVAQNFLNQIAVIKLDDDFLSGTFIKGITDPDFGVPTTIDDQGSSIYAVNAHYDIAPPPGVFPDVEFEVVRVRK